MEFVAADVNPNPFVNLKSSEKAVAVVVDVVWPVVFIDKSCGFNDDYMYVLVFRSCLFPKNPKKVKNLPT